jgi:hypothetical protein
MSGVDTRPHVDAAPADVAPEAPQTLAAAGLSVDLIVQLLLKSLHMSGDLRGVDLAERLGLSFTALGPAFDQLKAQQLTEVVGASTLGPPSYMYRITQAGRERAIMFLEANKYTGVAPVPLDQYHRYMAAVRTRSNVLLTRRDVERAFAHLVMTPAMLDQIGPAVSAGHSLFVYGPPGNGKTMLSQAIRDLLVGDLFVPHAIEVGGSIVQVFDPVTHTPRPVAPSSSLIEAADPVDRRWVRCRRPLVMVGGELTLEALDLSYNPVSGFYRAPIQLVANGGVLVVDDFGRQQCAPQALLNRWITPLESRIDFLMLQSGQKFEIPFMVLLVLATNVRPAELVDEAFLRRIRYKVHAEGPSRTDFARIFENCCRDLDIPYDPALVAHLLDVVYPPRKIVPRGCHPRDLIKHALELARYLEQPRRVTVSLLDAACNSYFVDAKAADDGYGPAVVTR